MPDENDLALRFVIYNQVDDMQEYVCNADLDILNEAVQKGFILLVEFPDGTRERTDPETVVEYFQKDKTVRLNIMEQEVTVPLLNAIIDVLQESYTPQIATMSVSAKKAANNSLDNLLSLRDSMNERYLPNIEGGESE